MFKTMIDTEGAKEAEESIRFNIMEKMQKVFEGQAPIFYEYFKKMTDENNQRLSVKYANNNNEGQNYNENINADENDDNNKDNLNNYDNDCANTDKDGISINKTDITSKNHNSNLHIIQIFNYEVEKKLLVTVLMYVFLVLFIFYNLKVIFIDREFSFDKFVNTMLLVAIFFILNAIRQ